jgi:phenylacetate-CoA ligase
LPASAASWDTDEVVIVKGVNIFPQRIGQILAAIQGETLSINCCLPGSNQDVLEIKVEVRESMFFDRMVDQRLMINHLSQKLAQGIGVTGQTGGAQHHYSHRRDLTPGY